MGVASVSISRYSNLPVQGVVCTVPLTLTFKLACVSVFLPMLRTTQRDENCGVQIRSGVSITSRIFAADVLPVGRGV